MTHRIRGKVAAAVTTAAVAASAVTPFISVPMASAAGDKNYLEALAMSLYFYDSNACGSGITGGPLTWRGDCHTYDAEAPVGTLGSEKQYVDPDGDGKVDVSGGFHDAGDHIKFNLTIGFGMNALALSEYMNPGVYKKAGAYDHLLYELRRGSDYMMKTTFLDDSGKVAAVASVVANGGEDHAIWTAPEVQTYARPIYWLTANDNNSTVCCSMAGGLAGTAWIYKDVDPDYSAQCAKYAKALLEFAQKHVGNNNSGQGGYYDAAPQYQDEEAWAQAWLWVLGEGEKPERVPQRGDYGGQQYDGYVLSWDKVWQGYAALMCKASGDQAFYDEIEYEYPNEGGISATTYNATGWGAARYNCAKQFRGLVLAKGDKDSEYAKAAKFQMDHILGDNSLGYSFLLGYGDKWPSHIHHRAANPGENGETSAANPSAKYTNYGMLVGGDDTSGYQDHADKYQYTEGALDYNGCFALACAGLADLYGGDASAMPALAASAAEINENFVFGSSSSSQPDEKDCTLTVNFTDLDGNSIEGVNARLMIRPAPGSPDPTVTIEEWVSDGTPKQFSLSMAKDPYVVEFRTPEGYTVYNDGGTGEIFFSDDKKEVNRTFRFAKTASDRSTLNISFVDQDGNPVTGISAMLVRILDPMDETISSWRSEETPKEITVTKNTEDAPYVVRFTMPYGYTGEKPEPIVISEGGTVRDVKIVLKKDTETPTGEAPDFTAEVGGAGRTMKVGDISTISVTGKGFSVSANGEKGVMDWRVMSSDNNVKVYQLTAKAEGSFDFIIEIAGGKKETLTFTVGELSEPPLYGDANCDNKVNVADAVAVLQFVANQTKYPLTEHGLTNADIDGQAGITGTDAITIQKLDAGILSQSDFPLKK